MQIIHELIARAATRFPERPALMEPTEVSGGGEADVTTLIYAMLQQCVQQFACALQKQRIEQGGRVPHASLNAMTPGGALSPCS